MRNFMIFFQEKEGSTAMVHYLDLFPQVRVVRREMKAKVAGWEPFDRWSCGSLALRDLDECLNIIYRDRPVDMARLNSIYLKTGRAPLMTIDPSKSLGFKFRLKPPWDFPGVHANAGIRNNRIFQLASDGVKWINLPRFENYMLRKMVELDLVVFVAVRQDLLRWALSKYHGDGQGRKGHLQFKLANGRISKEDIPKIRVNSRRLKVIVRRCQAIHEKKRSWARRLSESGVRVYPLRYEDLLEDREGFFIDLLDKLDISMTRREAERILESGIAFKKVHSDDISEYVINHEEITEKFGDLYNAWETA